jgi:serine/threonine protein kinase
LAKRIKETKKEGKKFEETQIFNWSLQATTALKYLHFEKKIAHRDIKPK